MTSSTRRRPVASGIALVSLAILGILLTTTARAGEATEASTFGVDGVATQSLGTRLSRTSYEAAVARPDGGLLVRQDSRVVALLADGVPDPAFAPIPAKTQGDGLFTAADGKAFVVDERKVTRLSPDGTPDASFGDGGTVQPEIAAEAVGELGSGKIVLASVDITGPKDPGLRADALLLNQDGSQVGTEIRSGMTNETQYGKGVYEIAPTPDGGVLIVAARSLFKLRADGSPDPNFGRDGLVSGPGSFYGARFLADGSLEVIAGHYLAKKGRSVPAIYRYTAAGRPDTSFGRDGVRFPDLPEWDEVTAILWGADGSAVVGGQAEPRGSSCAAVGCEAGPAVFALDADGNLDQGFGEGGQIRFAVSADQSRRGGVGTGTIAALTRRPDGSIVATGTAGTNATVAFAAALSPQGDLSPSFGEEGIVRASEPVPARQRVAGLASLPSGQILAAGTGDVGVAEYPILARYTPDGNLDPAFGGGTGFVSLGGIAHKVGAFAVRGEQALVGVSRSRGRSVGRLLLLSTADGSPVTSFGGDGDVDLTGKDSARAVTLASDGDPVVLDSVVPEGEIEEPVLIRRFDPDGGPDRAFGRGGRALLELPEGGLKVDTVIAGPGGRVLVGGSAHHRLLVASLLPDGSLDPRFGSGGWATVEADRETGAVDLVRQGRRIYLAGIIRGSHPKLMLARFDLHGHLDRAFDRGGTSTAPVQFDAEPTAILPTRAGAVVVVDRGRRPVTAFDGAKVIQTRPVGATRPLGDVRATVSLGRLIVGWTQRTVGFIDSPDYSLSAGPLRP